MFAAPTISPTVERDDPIGFRSYVKKFGARDAAVFVEHGIRWTYVKLIMGDAMIGELQLTVTKTA